MDRKSRGEPLRLFLAEDNAQTWQEASSNAIIRLMLAERMDFEEFCHSFSSHVATANEGKANIFLRLGRDHPCQIPSTVQQLYSSLCLQFLEQQPSLIQWIRHFYPNLRDAILGVDGRWKSRALARCLRTLLLIPKRGATYCLIHYASDSSRKDILAQILALMQESEISFRLLVSTSPNTETGLNALDTSPSVDLSSSDGTAWTEEERKSPLQGRIKDRSTELWARMVTTHDDAVLHYEEMSASRTEPTLPSNSGHILMLSEQTLSKCIDNSMTWALRAMVWASFAIRPLSRIEMEQALEIVCADERSIPIEMQHGRILLHALELALPGFFSITDDVVSVPPQLVLRLSGIWAKHPGCSLNPELHLARTCFALAAARFQERSPAATTHPESKTKAAADHGATEPPSSNSSKAHRAIIEYATRYWIEHHLRGTRDASNAGEAFRGTLDGNPLFNRNSWIQHLASSYWSPDIGEGLRDKIHPDVVQKTFELSSWDACYISFRMATLPLAAEDDFDWLFLGIASERLPEDAYFNMILSVQETLYHTCRQSSMLQRVIAAAPSSLRARLLTKFDSGDFLRKSFVEILLIAIAIGNESATIELLTMAPDYALGHKQEDAGPSSLGTALQVACEYGDSDVVKRILNFSGDLSPLPLEESYPWNALHVACHQGQASLVADLMQSAQFRNGNQTLDTDPPSQFSPLLITSARGLFALSEALKPLRLKILVDEEDSMSALQLACKYGFLKTLESLFDIHGCRLSLKSHDNYALFLALRSGKDEVATRVYEEYLTVVVGEIIAARTRHSHDGNDSDSSSDSFASVGQEEDKILVAAEEIIGKALFTAVECYRMRASFQSIMRNLREPSKLKDPKGRTPLMVSAMIGAVELVEQLYVKGDEPIDNEMRTAMHYACDHGHLAVVEFLLAQGESVSLKAQDNRLSTPITEAAVGGHQKIVELLVPRLSGEDLKAEFILAAKNGLERTLGLILKAATNIDPAAREECVNAKGEGANTPLHYAAESNHARVVQFLLLRGANIEAVNQSAMTPLALASLSSSLDSLRQLLDAGASTETPIKRKRSVLTEAIFHENEAVVQLLLEYGAVTRLSDYWSYYSSLLEFTLMNSSTSVLKVLLKHFDKMKRLASGGSLPEEIPTPTEVMRLVIRDGRPSSFDALVQVWDEFEPVMREGDLEIGSILKYAARYGSAKILCRIWEHSKDQMDVNEVGGYDGTALQAALISQREPAAKVKALIDWGAKPAPQSGEGGEGPTPAPLDSSAAFDANLLHGYWGTALHAAAISADKDIVALILGQQGDLKNQPDMMGRLPLHLATIGDDWELAKQLTSDKSTIASEDRQHRNALHMACGIGSVSFVQEVLEDENLADSLINKTDIDGWTPLHWACRSERRELVKILIDKGARITERTIRPAGWLPYHVAVFHDWESQSLTELRVDNGDSDDAGGDKPTEAGESTRGACDCCRCVSSQLSPGLHRAPKTRVLTLETAVHIRGPPRVH